MDKRRNKEGLNGTRAVDDLLEDVKAAMEDSGVSQEDIEKTPVGWIYFWSDGFLRCFIKQKDNSVWILTVTVCPPEALKSNGKNTYVLAMGKSSDDHTPVIEHYLQEAKDLMKGFECYFGDRNEIGRMSVSMVTWNADRPERHSILHIKKEGIYGKITSWSADVNETTFPACSRCFRKRALRLMKMSDDGVQYKCQCDDWTLCEDPNEKDNEKRQSPVKKDYPGVVKSIEGFEELKGREPGRKYLGPKKLTTAFMQKALQYTFNERVDGHWTKQNAAAYLTSCNLNGHLTRLFEEKVEQVKKKEADRNTALDEIAPTVWNLIDRYDRFKFPDLPMHGFGHGILPDTMNIIHHILSRYKKFTAFVTFANEILIDIESFRLDYCKVKTLPKAAWVSENSMAYMRLFSYLYGMFLSKVGLGAGGNGTDQGNELNLRRMINAVQALASVLMSDKEIEEKIIDDHVKLFMSTAHLLHESYGYLGMTETDDKSKHTKATKKIEFPFKERLCYNP